jgi:hypothetical protein
MIELGKKDREQLALRGISEEQLEKQLEMIRAGVSYTRLDRPVSIDDGLLKLQENVLSGLAELARRAADEGRLSKFVPASGAASRMFKSPLAILEDSTIRRLDDLKKRAMEGDGAAADVEKLIQNLPRFAFMPELAAALSANELEAGELLSRGEFRPVLDHLLTSRGLGYASLPKALLTFHSYPNGTRTALEEQLAEAAEQIADRKGLCRLHFTISTEHQPVIAAICAETAEDLQANRGLRIEATFSDQKPGTDTIACDPAGDLFRDDAGRILFRPGGHGALIDNLEECGGDVVLIKNIDNVLHDRAKGPTHQFKAALTGYLVFLQSHIFRLLDRLADGDRQPALLEEAAAFIHSELSRGVPPGIGSLTLEQQARTLQGLLNRPLRVCGMVKNIGEPGGGPYWVRQPDGTVNLQIVESAQVDKNDPGQAKILAGSGYFNPVDLVCGIRDHRGQPFELSRFVNHEAVFISKKSWQGRELRALELPGLWNGAMAHWNTVFIEAPISTFSPVKTVLDLLKPDHQPGEFTN